MWTVAIIIIPGFLIWGIGMSSASRKSTMAASVNRQDISQRDYYQALNETEQNYRKVFGDKYDEFAGKLNLEKGVLEELIREKILDQQARKRRIRVSDREVLDTIKSDPVFKDEKGVFSHDKFQSIIANVPPAELTKIEEGTRQRLKIQKLKQQVVSETTIAVTDAEVNDYVARVTPPAPAKGVKTPPTAPDKEQVRKMILWQKEEKYFSEWYGRVRKAAKVETYVTFTPPAQPTAQLPPTVSGPARESVKTETAVKK